MRLVSNRLRFRRRRSIFAWLHKLMKPPITGGNWPVLQVSAASGWVYHPDENILRKGDSRFRIWIELVYRSGAVPNPSHQDLVDFTREVGLREQLGRELEFSSGDCAFGRFGTVRFASMEHCRLWYLSNGRDFVQARLSGSGEFEAEARMMVETARFNGWLTPEQQAAIAGFGTAHPEPRLVVNLPKNWVDASRENPEGGPTYRPRDTHRSALQISLRGRHHGETLVEKVVEFANAKFPGETVGMNSGDCALGEYAAIEVKCAGDFVKIYYLSNGADLVLATLIGFSAGSAPLREGDGIVLGLQLRPPGWCPDVTIQ